jgi:hypothetical protein
MKETHWAFLGGLLLGAFGGSIISVHIGWPKLGKFKAPAQRPAGA